MMRKTIGFLLGLLASVWSVPAAAVGTIPGISFSQVLDTTGVPLGGGLLYLIQAGTTSTPQNCFQDTGLTIPYPNPVPLDAYGRVPQLFCADGQIKVRITDKNGVQKLVQDNLLIIGASSGGGGGGSVDPTTILTTGDFKMQYGTGPINGFVRCNGRTIGSATSGGTERANADTSALYSFLWNADPNLAVTGGRGANAAADFAANKPMALPDCRGRVIAGLDDMGNSAAARYTGATFLAGNATTLGSTPYGATIGQTNFPNINLTSNAQSVTVFAQDANSVRGTGTGSLMAGLVTSGGGGVESQNYPVGGQTVPLGGSGTTLPTFSPSILTTVYLKL